jgi:uncharacterized membrane protein
MASHPNARLEAFCDGVFAIALTLLIIDVRIPVTTEIHTSADLWRALAHLLPSVFAFLLSFGIIFISWVNHRVALQVVEESSEPFIYANALLMLGVVFVPFPTALLGENLFTDHAAPAVVLYSATGAIMAAGWALMSRTALQPVPLTRNEQAAQHVRRSARHAYFALAFYTTCAIVAFWLPLATAAVITLVWIYWLVWGIRAGGKPRFDWRGGEDRA